MFVSKKTKKSSGFTLIELLVAISILCIFAALTVTGLQTFAYRSGHTGAAYTVLGALKEAQSRTLASDGDIAFGVHFETSQVVIFQGVSYIAGDVNNDIRTLPARTSITAINLGGGDDVFFTRLNGNASPTGTITVAVTAEPAKNRTITIYETGLSEISN